MRKLVNKKHDAAYYRRTASGSAAANTLLFARGGTRL